MPATLQVHVHVCLGYLACSYSQDKSKLPVTIASCYLSSADTVGARAKARLRDIKNCWRIGWSIEPSSGWSHFTIDGDRLVSFFEVIGIMWTQRCGCAFDRSKWLGH